MQSILPETNYLFIYLFIYLWRSSPFGGNYSILFNNGMLFLL